MATYSGMLYAQELSQPYSESTEPIWGKKGRKAAALAHALPKGVEGWVRGFARLNRDTGSLEMAVELETDSTLAGPEGRISVTLRAADEKNLATIAMKLSLARGGKSSGSAESTVFPLQSKLPISIAQQTATLVVSAECTGTHFGPFSIDLAALAAALIIILA